MPKLELTTTVGSADLITLPKDVFLDMPSRDLLLRLLEIQPHKRLKSVRSLGAIAFYKGYNFSDIKDKRIRPKDILVDHFGEEYDKIKENNISFEGFDEDFIVE